MRYRRFGVLSSLLTLPIVISGCWHEAIAGLTGQFPHPFQSTSPAQPAQPLANQGISRSDPQSIDPQSIAKRSGLDLAVKPTHVAARATTTKNQAAPNHDAPPANAGYRLEMYHSYVMGGQRTYGVSLPPGYAQHPYQRYPVIFLLHGGHGNPNDWFLRAKGNAIPVIQKLYADKKLPPSIIITPDGNDLRGSNPFHDPDYLNGPHGQVDTAIGEELVKIIQSRYRTLPAPNFWAIGGLSSGGWGAVNVGLHHLNHFSIVFSHSGYFKEANSSYDSPIDFVQGLPEGAYQQLRVYLDAGQGDGEFLNETAQFHQVLDQMNVMNVFNAFPGGHGMGTAHTGWHYWHEHLADSLTFVGEQFRMFELVETAKHPGQKLIGGL